jgi:hypothetical protein
MGRGRAARAWPETLADASSRLGTILLRPLWLEIPVFLALAATYLYHSVRSPYPMGAAGLYTLMAELVAQKPFPMPMEVPYYGPGGLPFAYPPVAAYVTALFIGPLRIPALDFLRWEPAILCILTMLAVYAFAKQLWGDRLKALAGVAIAFSAETVFMFHGTASGSVRALALLWSFLAAWSALLAYTCDRHWRRDALLAGFFLGLTGMTHLAYAAFLAPGILLMAFLHESHRPMLARASVLATIVAVGIVVSAPWWMTIIRRYGLEVLLNAGSSHGTLSLLKMAGPSPVAVARSLLRWYANLGGTWWPPFLAGIALVGLAYGVARRRWLLPAWTVVVVATLGGTERFEILLAGLLAGEALVDLARFAGGIGETQQPGRKNALASSGYLALTLAPVMFLGFRGIQWTDAVLSKDLLEATSWVRSNSPEGSRYLYLGRDDAAEWVPYLTRRAPGIGRWGGEWTGTYGSQGVLEGELVACVQDREVGCLDRLMASLSADITLLIVPQDPLGLVATISGDKRWIRVFESPGCGVYERTG